MVKKSRNTKQRDLLGREIGKFISFFTAEELHEKVSKRDPGLGIATVYRFLNELVKKGGIHSYTCNRRAIYSVDKKSHCHFKCERCGKISHIGISSLDFIKNKVEGSICHFQIDVSGICGRCRIDKIK